MELIKNLDILKIGDWVKVYPNNEKYWKIGEITHKWYENKKPRFQLRIAETSLPKITEKLMRKYWEDKFGVAPIKQKENINIHKKDIIYKLNQKEKDKIIKKQILEKLK